MSEPALPLPLDDSDALAADAMPHVPSKSRLGLLKRLADVVCLPGSRVNAFERAMTADLLVEVLREAAPEERGRVSRRLANVNEIPSGILRLLLRDSIDVARPLLELSAGVGDADLIDCARHASLEHRRLIAMRRGVSDTVCDVLASFGEAPVIEMLLRNDLTRLSHTAVEAIVAATRENPHYIPMLLRRPELRPSHAYVLFWWADADARLTILQRFAVSREVLQDATSDLFAHAAAEGWQDPVSRKALQFIERRQRNRAAIAKSPFGSLEEAVAATERGFNREVAEEISYLAGVKPMTGAKLFTDPGGEPIAILCKATGLPKAALRQLWRAMRRPETDASGAPSPALERVLMVFDMVAVDRAQTVLRYWNWALSSALTPALLRAIREGQEEAVDDYSTPQRAAMLVLGRDLSR